MTGSTDLWFAVVGGVLLIGAAVHWYRPFLSTWFGGIEVDTERLSRFEIVVGRIIAISMAFVGAFLLWLGPL